MKELLIIITFCYLFCVYAVLKKILYYKDDERGQMIIRNSSISSFATMNLGFFIIVIVLYNYKLENNDYTLILMIYLLIINLTNYLSILYYEKKI